MLRERWRQRIVSKYLLKHKIASSCPPGVQQLWASPTNWTKMCAHCLCQLVLIVTYPFVKATANCSIHWKTDGAACPFGLVVSVCFLDDALLFNRMLHSSGLMDVRTPTGIIMRNFGELFASIYISGFSDASLPICNYCNRI